MKSESEPNKEKAHKVNRRLVLGVLTLSGGMLAAAMFYRKTRRSLSFLEIPPSLFKGIKLTSSYSTKPVDGIPQSWVDKKGLEVLRYANFIQDLGLKNITPRDVLYPHFKTRGRTRNAIPPRFMWKNIVPTLRLIDKMATHINAKIKPLISAYRSPKYNRAIHGKSRSQHLINGAVDVKFEGIHPVTVARIARKFREAGHFSGGVGPAKSFTHIDTRGHNVDW